MRIIRGVTVLFEQKKIDIRLKADELSMLRSMIGRELTAYMHDEFLYTQSSSQVMVIVVEGVPYYLYSFTEALDYYGTVEDVAVWTVSDEKYPVVDKKSFVQTPVNETIKGISLIQENQRMYCDAGQTYDVWLTRGIIFDLGDRQIAFEKDVWLSEEIMVHNGCDLAGKFAPAERFGQDWDKTVRTECSRVEEPVIPE